MSPGEREGRAVATRGFLDEDGIAVHENPAGPDEELLPALSRSEHRFPPRRPDGARRPGHPTGPPRDTTPPTRTAPPGGAGHSSPRPRVGPAHQARLTRVLRHAK